jgi:hypothetical protein
MANGCNGAGRPTLPRGRCTLPMLPSLREPLPVLSVEADRPKPKPKQSRLTRDQKPPSLPRTHDPR